MSAKKMFIFDPTRLRYYGLSTDGAPTNVPVGTEFLMTDLRQLHVMSSTGGFVIFADSM